MKFRIDRVSNMGFGGNSDEEPTEGAYQEEDVWYIDIDSLSELMELENKEGSIIIQDNYEWQEEGKTILIYDGYIEG